jgi:hypothetical protein
MRAACFPILRRGLRLATFALAAATLAVAARAQEAAPEPALPEAAAPEAAAPEAAAPEATAPAGEDSPFGPGVLTVIPPEVDRDDTISVHDIVELRALQQLQWQPSEWLTWQSATSAPTNRPLFEMAQGAAFVQDVWCLEFAFKPLRMVEVDVPQRSGRAQRKQIWYMVYRVRNTGAGLAGEIEGDGEYVTAEKATDSIRFQPRLVLASQDRMADEPGVRKAYLDRLVPVAMDTIRERELPGGDLLNSVQMAERDLAVEDGRTQRGAWGVAMWEDVDAETDFFSIYVGGLTNAYRWQDPEGAYQAGDAPGKGRKFARKTLQLNFWRPGDALNPEEREFRYGAAPGEAERYGGVEGVAYQWVYR